MRVPASYVPEPLYLVRTSLGRTAPPRTVAPQAKQCAPLAANSSASELLRRLRAEYSTAEVVSSFDAESPSGGPFRKACTSPNPSPGPNPSPRTDPNLYPHPHPNKASWWSFTLADGMAGDELLNQWEVRVKHNES